MERDACWVDSRTEKGDKNGMNGDVVSLKIPKNFKKLVVKGLNYTRQITRGSIWGKEVVQQWMLERLRKPKECGIWVDGQKICGLEGLSR